MYEVRIIGLVGSHDKVSGQGKYDQKKSKKESIRPKPIKAGIRTTDTGKHGEVIELKAARQGLNNTNQMAFTTISDEIKVDFGDKVTIKDARTRDTFDVDVEGNPYNRHLMSDIQKGLLGTTEGDIIRFE
ncbi:MAG: hypothetical protein M0T74_14135 [Desulfitobacterium hafniense]|nr:hypothetical protein [Desulfitobacterium hafniense]